MKYRNRIGLGIATLFLMFFADFTPASAQSFNCRYARTADEVLICQDSKLSALDGQMAELYSKQRQNIFGSPRIMLERNQKAWLKSRNQCGRDKACIEQGYRKRIQELTSTPLRVSECVQTKIAEFGFRLEGELNSGSRIRYANDIYGVSYDIVSPIHRSRVGDVVLLCLVSVPDDCPEGDDRGKVYSAINLRTREGWSLPDSQHMCGGA